MAVLRRHRLLVRLPEAVDDITRPIAPICRAPISSRDGRVSRLRFASECIAKGFLRAPKMIAHEEHLPGFSSVRTRGIQRQWTLLRRFFPRGV